MKNIKTNPKNDFNSKYGRVKYLKIFGESSILLPWGQIDVTQIVYLKIHFHTNPKNVKNNNVVHGCMGIELGPTNDEIHFQFVHIWYWSHHMEACKKN